MMPQARRDHDEVTPDGRPLEYRFEGVAKRFVAAGDREFTAVTDIDLKVDAESFICLVGPSGCGKSTLLNLAAGLYQPSEGTVYHREQPVRSISTDVGYITQHETLLPWRTVAGNVAVPLEIRKVPRRERKAKIAEALELVGLGRFADRYPSQLSGGMRQRLMLARTWVYEPSTLLMDEPFGALDAIMRATLQRELLSLWESHRRTVLFVTHDLEEALILGDQVVVFATQPGRIVSVAKVDLPRPRDPDEVRGDPRFLDARDRLWNVIRDRAPERRH